MNKEIIYTKPTHICMCNLNHQQANELMKGRYPKWRPLLLSVLR